MIVTFLLFFWIITVDGIEFKSAFTAELKCFVKQTTFADSPKN